MSEDRNWPDEFRVAASVLLKAAIFAERLRRSPWDFAVEIGELCKLGLSRTDIRWLICQGLIEHADEVHGAPPDGRRFRPSAELALTKCSCFVLTSVGRSVVSRLAAERGCGPNANGGTNASMRPD